MSDKGIGCHHEGLHETLTLINDFESSPNIKEEVNSEFIVTIDPCENGASLFFIEEYEQPSELVQHPSVANDEQSFMERISDLGHCFLCIDRTFKKQGNIRQHFLNAHLRHGLHLAGKLVVVCRLGCKVDMHFHCPHSECLFSCKSHQRLRLHYHLNHEPISGRDGIELLKEEDRYGLNGKVTIKIEPDDFEDAVIGLDMEEPFDFAVDSEISVKRKFEQMEEEDDSYNLEGAKPYECSVEITEPGFEGMLQEHIVEDKTLLHLLKQPSEKPSIAHSAKELLNSLEVPKCYLCIDKLLPNKSRLMRHFKHLHLNHSITIANKFVASCKLDCSYGPLLLHYHCPFPNCLFTNTKKLRVVNHFKDHLKRMHIREKIAAGPTKPFIDGTEMKQRSRIFNRTVLNEDMSYLPPPKKSYPFHGVLWTPHASIGPSLQSLYEQLCLPFCFLCREQKMYYNMCRLERHFKLAHLNRAIDCGSCYLVHCGLNCLEDGVRDRHYHCPYCPLKHGRRCAFWIHLETHRREGHVAEQLKKIKEKSEVKVKVLRKNTHSDWTASMPGFNQQENHLMQASLDYSEALNESFKGLTVLNIPCISHSEEAALSRLQLPHCYLCHGDKDHICLRRLAAHFKRSHLKRSIRTGHLLVMFCKLLCNGRDEGHYHCIFCPFVAVRRERVEKHIEKKHVNAAHRKTLTAEYNLPEVMEDHTIPDDWIHDSKRDAVRKWESTFNSFLYATYSKKGKKNSIVMNEKKKHLIFNHTRLNMDIENKSLKNWVWFRRVKVVSCEQLDLRNKLVLPLTKYSNDEERRAINVQPEPLMEGINNIMLTSGDPEHEFFQSYRIIPTHEEMFKLLYDMHVMKADHPSPKTMFWKIRRKFVYFPKFAVDRFVSLCPTCGSCYPDNNSGAANKTPPVTIENADTIVMASLQVTLIDMTEHPDGPHRYVVECFDRCSRLCWLMPVPRPSATELAESVVRSVLAVTGLPLVVTTNCGQEFLEKLLSEVDRLWHGSCDSLIKKSLLASGNIPLLESTALMEALQDLVTQQPDNWVSALPHLQYRLNHHRNEQSPDHPPFEAVFGRQRCRAAHVRPAPLVKRGRKKREEVETEEEVEEEEVTEDVALYDEDDNEDER